MTLSKKYLLLWSGRSAFFSIIIIPVVTLSDTPFLHFILLGVADTLVAVFTFVRYKTFTLITGNHSVIIKSGIFIRKVLEIKYTSVCALRTFATPLAKHLNLQNLVIYCEGVTFFLPALDTHTVRTLQNKLCRKEM